MKQFEEGEISREFYLKEMGAISLKADKTAGRFVEEDDVRNPPDSEDKLQDISRITEDSIDQDDPFAAALPRHRRRAGDPRREQSQRCPVCSKGFQLRRNPPLHTTCKSCNRKVHNRCLRSTLADQCTEICFQCNNPPGEVLLQEVARQETSTSIAPTVRNGDLTLEEGDIVIPFHGLPFQEIATTVLPAYTEYATAFDLRMDHLGFQRSPTQMNTYADGNCALYALMDQIHQPFQDLGNLVDQVDSMSVRLVGVSFA